jgi:hypothetical protein
LRPILQKGLIFRHKTKSEAKGLAVDGSLKCRGILFKRARRPTSRNQGGAPIVALTAYPRPRASSDRMSHAVMGDSFGMVMHGYGPLPVPSAMIMHAQAVVRGSARAGQMTCRSALRKPAVQTQRAW